MARVGRRPWGSLASVASSSTAGARWVGAVLTGGQSTRMGRDKALVEVDGVPMAVRVATALRDAGAAEVVCVGGDLDALRALGLVAEPDPRPGEGPLAGVLAAMEAAGQAVAAVVVVACDLPWLPAAIPEALVGRVLASPAVEVVCARTDRPEPLCAAWRPSALGALRVAFDSGERAVHRAWAGLARGEVPVDPAGLRDVDAPEDLPPPR
jgi:molybdenum cofactor guanylyltransferase